jgi:asparagine synthase (glutamine-hydrolysing)
MCNAGQIEKKLLRDSFKNEELLPYDILYRRKEAFSNGVSGAVDWYEEMIRRFIEPMISDNELLNSKYEHCPPRTKEALYYRQIFEEYYPSCANVITHLWLPPVELCGEFTDPSARILPVYV